MHQLPTTRSLAAYDTPPQVNCLKITPDKQFLAAAGNPHVRLFEINSQNSSALVSYNGHSSNVTDVGEMCHVAGWLVENRCGYDGRWLPSLHDGYLWVFAHCSVDQRHLRPYMRLVYEDGYIGHTCCGMSTLILSGAVRIHQHQMPVDQMQDFPLQLHANIRIPSLLPPYQGFQKDAKWMYTGSEDGAIKIWDVRAPSCQGSYDVGCAVTTVALHPNQAELISGDVDGKVKVTVPLLLAAVALLLLPCCHAVVVSAVGFCASLRVCLCWVPTLELCGVPIPELCGVPPLA